MLRRPLLLLALCAALPGIRAEESERAKAFLKGFKGAETPAAKTAAVERFAAAWDEDAAATLLKVLKPKEDPDVLVAIVQAGASRAGEGATALLKAALGLQGPDEWRARGTAVSALLKRNAPGDFGLAMTAAQDKDGRVLQFLCDGLGTSPDPGALDALAPFLEHKDWRVRAAAIAAVGRKTGSDAAVNLLTGRLSREEGRLVGDLLDALKRLTGQSLGPDPKAWAQWAAAKREQGDGKGTGTDAIRFEEAEGYGGSVTYHGVTSFSKRILFVFDRTGSMTTNDNIGKEKKHLIEAIESLGKAPNAKGDAEARYDKKKPQPVSFNILMFSDGKVEPWQQTLVPATEENKKSAIAFVQRQTAVGWTNTWTAMKAALDMARGGAPPRGPLDNDLRADVDTEEYGYGKSEADTIFLLSDGSPTKPPGNIMDDWAAIADRIREYNLSKRCIIHTVGIGAALDPFMQRIADESGGTYTKVP